VTDCPVNILVIGAEPPTVGAGRENDCIGCQHCLAVCPTGAVSVQGKNPDDSLPLHDAALPSLETVELLVKGRRSVRRYRDEDVDRVLLQRLLTSALQAPTARNNHQVAFTVVDRRSDMDRLRRLTMECAAEALRAGTVAADYGYLRQMVEGWQRYEADLLYRWAPHLLVASAPRESAAPFQDTTIALSYFELLARVAGLGVLWNGMAVIALRLFPELRQTIGLPDGQQIGFAMSFGWPAVTYHRTVQHDSVPICWVSETPS
jgi:nitroreductase